MVTAFLEVPGETIYFAHAPEARPGLPHSAITRLIQGIWETEAAQARRILRRRIFTSANVATPMCTGMVKVAAKRLSLQTLPDATDLPGRDVSAQGNPELAQAPAPEPAPGPPRSPADLLAFALSLATEIPRREGPRYTLDRPVAAILADADGRILATAVNRNARNRTLHAEVRLAQAWHHRTGRGFPPGARVYVTLKCCRMCAGMLWQTAEQPETLHVHYAEDDPGPQARATELERRGAESRLVL